MLDSFVILAPLLLLLVVALLRFIGCESFTSAPAAGVVVKVDPDTATLGPGESKQFAAKVNGSASTQVNWSTNAPNGLFKAPDPFVAGGAATAEVTATSTTVAASVGKAIVTLKHVTVTVNPSSASLKPGQSQPFTATVTGSPNPAVTWSPNAPGGVFIAPPAPFVLGTPPAIVRAKSVADPTVEGTATVTFIGNGAKFVPPPDLVTKGTWKGVHGSAGFAMAALPANLISLPSFLTSLNFSPVPPVFRFADPTADIRGLQRPPLFADRISYVWFNNVGASPNLTLDFDFADFKNHRVAFYFCDFDRQNRTQRIEFFDTTQGGAPLLLDPPQTIANFGEGQYLFWDLSGRVRMVITKVAGPDVILHGIFFNS